MSDPVETGNCEQVHPPVLQTPHSNLAVEVDAGDGKAAQLLVGAAPVPVAPSQPVQAGLQLPVGVGVGEGEVGHLVCRVKCAKFEAHDKVAVNSPEGWRVTNSAEQNNNLTRSPTGAF